MLLLALLGCGDPCALRFGTSKLACQFDAAIAADSPADLYAHTERIEDQTTRDAAYLRWIGDHRGKVDQRSLEDVCQRMPEGERGSCLRRAQAAHLKP